MKTCKTHNRRGCDTCKALAAQSNPGRDPYSDPTLWLLAGYASGAFDSGSSSCDTSSSSSYDSGSSSSSDSGSSYSGGDCGSY